MADRVVLQDIDYFPGNADGHFFLSLHGGGAEMGRNHHFWMAQQCHVCRWFLFENIEGRSVRSALIQGFEQCIFINDPAAGNIDDLQFRFSLLEEVFTYNPFRLTGKWRMDGKRVRLGGKFSRFHLVGLGFLGLVDAPIRVEDTDSHADALRSSGYSEPDFSNTDGAKCLAVHFSPLVT